MKSELHGPVSELFPQRLKPSSSSKSHGTAEAVPLHKANSHITT